MVAETTADAAKEVRSFIICPSGKAEMERARGDENGISGQHLKAARLLPKRQPNSSPAMSGKRPLKAMPLRIPGATGKAQAD
ncbi:MAG: hypothetical protein VX047_05790 [Pseudomonadota bacterium]|nr:hypothetical protein [Pseudomonadota bacterium]